MKKNSTNKSEWSLDTFLLNKIWTRFTSFYKKRALSSECIEHIICVCTSTQETARMEEKLKLKRLFFHFLLFAATRDRSIFFFFLSFRCFSFIIKQKAMHLKCAANVLYGLKCTFPLTQLSRIHTILPFFFHFFFLLFRFAHVFLAKESIFLSLFVLWLFDALSFVCDAQWNIRISSCCSLLFCSGNGHNVFDAKERERRNAKYVFIGCVRPHSNA